MLPAVGMTSFVEWCMAHLGRSWCSRSRLPPRSSNVGGLTPGLRQFPAENAEGFWITNHTDYANDRFLFAQLAKFAIKNILAMKNTKRHKK
jgi:hypothetical protein